MRKKWKHFAGRDCTNGFRNRICFLVRDLDNRLCFGLSGEINISEEEHYGYWAKRLGLKDIREKNNKEIENQNCKYKNIIILRV